MQTQLALLREKINDGYDGSPTITKNTMQIGMDTRRAKLSNQQMANRYLKSIEGNPDIDINKPTEPRMKQKREIQCVTTELSIGKRRRATASEVQQNATVPPPPSAYEWRSSENCYHLFDSYFGLQCYEIRFDKNKLRMPETGITFETIGAGETCNDIGFYPIMIDINILEDVLSIFKESGNGLKNVFPSNYVLTNAAVCNRLKEFGLRECKVFNVDDPVTQIDQFLKSPKKYANGIVITDAEIIEAWGKRSTLLRETDLNAVALRQKNWKALHIGFGTAGAALGLAAIGGIMLRNRDKLIQAADRVKSAFQNCSHPQCCDVTEEDHQDDDAVDSDANVLNTIHVADAESSSVVDS